MSLKNSQKCCSCNRKYWRKSKFVHFSSFFGNVIAMIFDNIKLKISTRRWYVPHKQRNRWSFMRKILSLGEMITIGHQDLVIWHLATALFGTTRKRRSTPITKRRIKTSKIKFVRLSSFFSIWLWKISWRRVWSCRSWSWWSFGWCYTSLPTFLFIMHWKSYHLFWRIEFSFGYQNNTYCFNTL